MKANAKDWAAQTFGECDLGDDRRTKRLIKLAQSYAQDIGRSTVECCCGDTAQVEGAYRFLRNDEIKPEAIREGGFKATVKIAMKESTLLAIEDTTTLSYKHKAAENLGYTSNDPTAASRGFNVHSILLVSVETQRSIGLIEQSWDCRDNAEFGKSKNKRQRAYKDKESYKWEKASCLMSERLGEKMRDVISVCDREADIYNYLAFKLENQSRFVVRARGNRRTTTLDYKLFEEVLQTPVLGTYEVKIQQKGGRKARTAKVNYYGTSVELVMPKNERGKNNHPQIIRVNVVAAKEVDAPAHIEEPLEWILLTTETIASPEATRQIIKWYELRWRIEDYHKAWKSGVGVESLRLQTKENLERAGSILAFVAVKLLQVREIALSAPSDIVESLQATHLLTQDEWKILWIATKKSKPPKKTPNIKWVYEGLGKLGGWYDSKRTGIIGWKSLWKGWFRLMDKVEVYNDTKLYL